MRNSELDISSRIEQHPTLHTPAWPKFGPLATASFRRDFGHCARPDLTPSDCFLWGYLKGRVYRNKPRTIDALKANITGRNSASNSGRTGKDFPKYGTPGSILSARKWWPLPANVVMSSHFLHNEVSPLQI